MNSLRTACSAAAFCGTIYNSQANPFVYFIYWVPLETTDPCSIQADRL